MQYGLSTIFLTVFRQRCRNFNFSLVAKSKSQIIIDKSHILYPIELLFSRFFCKKSFVYALSRFPSRFFKKAGQKLSLCRLPFRPKNQSADLNSQSRKFLGVSNLFFKKGLTCRRHFGKAPLTAGGKEKSTVPQKRNGRNTALLYYQHSPQPQSQSQPECSCSCSRTTSS